MGCLRISPRTRTAKRDDDTGAKAGQLARLSLSKCDAERTMAAAGSSGLGFAQEGDR
jgi:hypothetical protein